MILHRVDRPHRKVLSRLDAGALIREVRHLAGLSQTELARRIGTKQPTVSRWERNLESPRVETLSRILQACGFEADIRFRRHDDVDAGLTSSLAALDPDTRVRFHENALRTVIAGRKAMRERIGA